MGAVVFIPQTVHHRAYSTICKPIGDGSLLCEPIVNDTVGDKVAATIFIMLSVVAVGMVLKVCFDAWREEKEYEQKRKKLEEELAKSVSERMPKP